MNIMQQKLPFILVALFFISSMFLGSTQRAGAAGASFVRWKINLDLSKSVPTVVLTVQKWTKLAGGKHNLDDEKIFELSCQTVGDPKFVDGEIVFDGSSYVACALPSIKTIAWTNWNMAISDSCSAKRPYIAGSANLESSPIALSPVNPIFYRDDIQFNLPLDVNSQQATLDASFGNVSAASAQFAISPSGHVYSAEFVGSGNIFNPSFSLDGSPISAAPAVINQSAIVSNLASTIYFGYSPQSGEYLQGTLGPTEIDPVCPTTG